jgi:hypothetical protein
MPIIVPYSTTTDIENLADQGQRELLIGENIVLTDLAKQTANMLGIRITEKSSGASAARFATDRPQPVRQIPRAGSKPRGCQRRPGNKPAPASRTTAGQSRPVVDKLVEKIKRINQPG